MLVTSIFFCSLNVFYPPQKDFLFLTLKAPITTIIALAASVDQDQAAQNLQPDLGSTLSTVMKHCRQKQQ